MQNPKKNIGGFQIHRGQQEMKQHKQLPAFVCTLATPSISVHFNMIFQWADFAGAQVPSHPSKQQVRNL